jgi:DNA-binding PadR family transcriptional regulator
VAVVTKRRKLSNPLALAVMATLAERPMHPYEIAQVLRQRGKEQSIKINYGSLYTVVQNLEKHGFVEVTGVQRQGNRPERTLYGLTETGAVEMHDWLADLISVPQHEYPAFEAALALILILPVEEAVGLLGDRVTKLELEVAGLRGVLEKLREDLPRIFIVETEYQAHMLDAEAQWVRGVIEEIRSGTLSGTAEWRQWHETREIPQEWADIEERTKDGSAAEQFKEELAKINQPD